MIHTLRLGSRLYDLEHKSLVMGIVNLTPDSFWVKSRTSERQIKSRLKELVDEGTDLIDLGAYSSRPGAEDVPEQEEKRRLEPAFELARELFPQVPLSVDTFRSSIARWAVEKYGVELINDISGGDLDSEMYEVVADLSVGYVLMHMRGTPRTMQQHTHYDDVCVEVADALVSKLGRLRDLGVKDVVCDLGFGFGKTLEQNYTLMARLPEMRELIGVPMLVGISRKSMIYRLLDTTPDSSLIGTTALNMYALLSGADILRVHDVRAAVEARTIAEALHSANVPTTSMIHTYKAR